MRVIVGSKNPVKINAAKLAFEKVFPDEEITAEGVSAPSGVSDQPMGDEETLSGARNRAHNARELMPDADFWVGMEGGNVDDGEKMEAMAWMFVFSKKAEGMARSGTFVLPQKLTDLVRGGMELGDANDVVFNDQNSKQKGGLVGALTGGLITRTDYYAHTMTLALIPFIKPEHYLQADSQISAA